MYRTAASRWTSSTFFVVTGLQRAPRGDRRQSGGVTRVRASLDRASDGGREGCGPAVAGGDRDGEAVPATSGSRQRRGHRSTPLVRALMRCSSLSTATMASSSHRTDSVRPSDGRRSPRASRSHVPRPSPHRCGAGRRIGSDDHRAHVSVSSRFSTRTTSRHWSASGP